MVDMVKIVSKHACVQMAVNATPSMVNASVQLDGLGNSVIKVSK